MNFSVFCKHIFVDHFRSIRFICFVQCISIHKFKIKTNQEKCLLLVRNKKNVCIFF